MYFYIMASMWLQCEYSNTIFRKNILIIVIRSKSVGWEGSAELKFEIPFTENKIQLEIIFLTNKEYTQQNYIKSKWQ